MDKEKLSWKEVESSHVDAIAHDGQDSLFIRYKAKAGPFPVYRHTPVSAEDHAKIMKRIEDGESVGRLVRNLEPRGVRLGD